MRELFIMMDVGALMHGIAARYRFTKRSYPDLGTLTEAQQRRFALNHSVLHVTKLAGKIAAELEAADHGKPLREAKMREAATKMAISALNLAQQLGVTSKDIADQLNKPS